MAITTAAAIQLTSTRPRLRPLLALCVFAMAGFLVFRVCQGDWVLHASTYTHDPATGHRVIQYAPVPPVVRQNAQPLTGSGMAHFRSSIQSGETADNYHRVRQWGNPIQPYAQWRFQFRPYGSPYDAWGPALPAAVQNGFGYGPFVSPVAPGGLPGAGASFPRQTPWNPYQFAPRDLLDGTYSPNNRVPRLNFPPTPSFP